MSKHEVASDVLPRHSQLRRAKNRCEYDYFLISANVMLRGLGKSVNGIGVIGAWFIHMYVYIYIFIHSVASEPSGHGACQIEEAYGAWLHGFSEITACAQRCEARSAK